MVIRELIQRVQNLYSRGVESDDTRLSSRHIYNKLLTARSKLLVQKLNKKQKVSNWDYQVLPCVNLEPVPPHSCPTLPPLGCRVLRSVDKLPKPIQSLKGHGIKTVTSVDRSFKIDEVDLNKQLYLKGNKYTSQKPSYFIEDGYLYLTVYSNIRMVSVVGLFEDPLESYPNSLNPLEEDFPIDSSLIEPLIELAVQELISIFVQMKEDKKGSFNED